jgi:hypothetical protein
MVRPFDGSEGPGFDVGGTAFGAVNRERRTGEPRTLGERRRAGGTIGCEVDVGRCRRGDGDEPCIDGGSREAHRRGDRAQRLQRVTEDAVL